MEKNKLDKQNCKNKCIRLNLYRKEQLVIGATVLCFVLSGLVLPAVKNRLINIPAEIPTESPKSNEENSKEKQSNTKKPKEDVSDTPTESLISTDSDNADTESETPNNNDNIQSPTDKKDTSTTTDDSQKEWVPPVYQTVHHPATTETRTFYYCSGAIDESGVICNIRFNSLEEWGAHKKTNGG